MSPLKAAANLAEMYDLGLKYARNKSLLPGTNVPRPTTEWPAGCLELLERYRAWLLGGGTSPHTIRLHHIPMAGHVLGLALKPPTQLDLEADLQAALDFVQARQMGSEWIKNCRNALNKFKTFLRLERGLGEVQRPLPEFTHYTDSLPTWLVAMLEQFLALRQGNWRPARLDQSTRQFWSNSAVIWRFFIQQCGVREFGDLKRKHLYAFISHRQNAGRAVSGINADLHELRSFLLFLQDEGYEVPQSLLRMPSLKQPEALPKYLTDEQVKLLRDEVERRVAGALESHTRRDALLDRAVFYLLWQGGLRLCEVEDLLLEDLDLAGRKLSVRQSKNLKDRTVFIADAAVRAVREYLQVRGEGFSSHVFLYRNRALAKELVSSRMRALGEAVAVKVHTHRLRHTTATQLLNAGCRITSIQKFLGHKKLNTTMIYARVHDQTVEADYFAAMGRVEKRLQVGPEPVEPPVSEEDRVEILTLAEEMANPEVEPEKRQSLFEKIRALLCRSQAFMPVTRPDSAPLEAWIPPPLALAAAD